LQPHLVHLICGSTGAGKTTYALQLSDRVGAVRFSIDEWMAALFWMDTPQSLDPAWSMERVERCLTQICCRRVILQSLSRRYILKVYIVERNVKTAKLFKNGESQAVRLPKEFRFAGDEVFIKRFGSAVVLLPKAKSWETLIDSLAKFPEDFMRDREQPTEVDRREGLD
jgi:antitoxin VapB